MLGTGRLKRHVMMFLRRHSNPIRSMEFIASPEYYRELQDLLHISRAEGFDLVRTGCEHDGGYILLNDFQAGNIAYSFGIAGDVSWDKDIASRGYDVFMFDHTIDALPEENPRFHWSKLGIADGIIHDDRLRPLDELIALNHHENTRSMILKMDVEGAEWGFFQQVSSETLSQFSQMTFEFHNIPNHDNPELVLEVFRKINRTHQLVHLHANNNGNYISFSGKKFCSLFEMTFALRSQYTFTEDYDVRLPLRIDSVNIPSLPEIELGRWNEHVDIGCRAASHVIVF
ncbi:MAG: FkbM family methyltransferase [Synergistaceae bacterium]|nr:FkbM family methyltransferase [Synergistaceae bacterium]